MLALKKTGLETKIVGGDFNTVLDEEDSSSKTPLPANKKLTRKAMTDLMSTHMLEDLALAHQNGRTHT